MDRCFYCYDYLDSDYNSGFHPKCTRKIFGRTDPPVIDFGMDKIKELAIKVLGKSVSITGVQPKLSLDQEKERGKENRLTIVGLWGKYILKPPHEPYPEMPELEDLTMHLAEIVNIKSAEHSLIKLADGKLAYISKRFDRIKNDKLHVEDMAQLTGTLTENKYRGSMEKIGKTILQFSDYSGLDVIKFFEIALFSFITGNSDMHLKNFSLLRDKDDEIIMSPAYDLISTKLLIPEDTEDLALTLNGKKSNFNKKDFDYFAEKLEIETAVLNNIYEKFRSSFNAMFDIIDKSFVSDRIKGKYKELLSNRRKILF